MSIYIDLKLPSDLSNIVWNQFHPYDDLHKNMLKEYKLTYVRKKIMDIYNQIKGFSGVSRFTVAMEDSFGEQNLMLINVEEMLNISDINRVHPSLDMYLRHVNFSIHDLIELQHGANYFEKQLICFMSDFDTEYPVKTEFNISYEGYIGTFSNAAAIYEGYVGMFSDAKWKLNYQSFDGNYQTFQHTSDLLDIQIKTEWSNYHV